MSKKFLTFSFSAFLMFSLIFGLSFKMVQAAVIHDILETTFTGYLSVGNKTLQAFSLASVGDFFPQAINSFAKKINCSINGVFGLSASSPSCPQNVEKSVESATVLATPVVPVSKPLVKKPVIVSAPAPVPAPVPVKNVVTTTVVQVTAPAPASVPVSAPAPTSLTSAEFDQIEQQLADIVNGIATQSRAQTDSLVSHSNIVYDSAITQITNAITQVTDGLTAVTAAIPFAGGSDGSIQFNNGSAFDGTTSLFWDNTNGRLGVGTTTPTTALAVQGDINFTGSIYQNGVPFGGGGGSGTVTSVAMTTPTGLSISGSPITTSGTLALTLTSGYNIPLTASTTQWAAASASTTALTPAYLRGLFSDSVTGLTYNSSTGATSLTAGYNIPLTASTTEWAAAAASTTALTPAYTRGLFSNSATGLTYTGGTGAFSLTAGYNIPLTASTTDWANFRDTPSSRITAGTGLSWSGNTLNATGGGSGNSAFTIGNGTIYNATSTDLVGIGTTTPGYNLTVGGDVNFTGNMYKNGSAFGSGTVTSVAMTTPTGLSISGSPITGAGTLALTLTSGYNIPLTASTTDWNTAFLNRITSASSPLSISSNVLSIANAAADGSTKGAAAFNSTNFSASSGVINTIQNINTTATPTFASTTLSNFTAGSIPFFAAGGILAQNNSKLFWDNTKGNLGIGTTSPNWALQIASTTPYLALSDTDAASGRKHLLLSNQDGVFNIGTSSDDLSSTSSAFSLDPGGPPIVGIGTSTPWYTLSVVGTMGINGLSSSAVGNAVCITANKEITTASAAVCNGVSSQRFKHDIENTDLGLSAAMALRPVTFRYKEGYGDSGKDQQFGFIAEETYAIDPRLAILGPDGLPTTVRYDFIAPILTKAIQEQEKKIEDLTLAVSAISTSTASTTVAGNTSTVSNIILPDDRISSLMASVDALSLRVDGLASTTASTTGDMLATSASFIAKIVDAIKLAVSTATDWVFAKITATLAVFNRVEVQTAAVSNGIEMTDSVNAQVYCVRITNGELAKTLGSCSVTATSTGETSASTTPSTSSVVVTNIVEETTPAPESVPVPEPTASKTPPVETATSTEPSPEVVTPPTEPVVSDAPSETPSDVPPLAPEPAPTEPAQ